MGSKVALDSLGQSRVLQPPRVDIDGIHGVPAAQKQPISIHTTEAQVADQTWCSNPAQQSAIWSNAMDPVTSTAPDIADSVHSNSIGIAIVNSVEIPAAGELRTAFLNVEQVNQVIRGRIIRGTCIDDIKHRLIR